MKDLYKILGIHADASDQEVKEAFKKRAKETHPDKGGSTEEFSEVKSAAMVLLNAAKRKRYDEESYIEEEGVDNAHSAAIEKVAQFFIQSIEAAMNNNINLNTLDLVDGGKRYFSEQMAACNRTIADCDRKIKQFEKAVKRLKTKRANDIIKRMLNSHTSLLKKTIESNRLMIRVCEEAKLILNDYEFEQDTSPSGNFQSGLFIPGRGFFGA